MLLLQSILTVRVSFRTVSGALLLEDQQLVPLEMPLKVGTNT